jgi:iron complex outermembrane receptor protein
MPQAGIATETRYRNSIPKLATETEGGAKMNIDQHGRRSFLVLCSMTVVAADAVAANDSEEKQSLEEIVVTAQLREQSLQDVPISIDVLGAAEIADKKIDDIGDISYEVPGFSVFEFIPRQTNAIIRGTVSLEDAAGVDQSVAVFLDGVYIGQPGFVSFDLFDVERVEVLKGPQGTLFGRNVTGGAVSVITSTPPDAFKATIEGTLGDYEQRDIQGVVGGPLSDSLAGQIAFSRKTSDGFYTNVTDGTDVEAADIFGVRGKLRYEVNDAVEMLLGIEYSRDKLQGIGFDLDGDPLPYMGTGTFGPDDEVALNLPGGLDNETWAYTGTINVDTSIGTITSITAYRDSENHSEYDVDSTPVVELHLGEDDLIEQFSQELRLTGQANNIDYVAGLFFMDAEQNRTEYTLLDSVPGSAARLFIWDGDPILEIQGQNIKTKSYAAYGEITYAFENGLSLTGGIRYTNDEKTGNSFCTSEGSFLLCPSPAATVLHDGSWDAVTPRFVAQYEFSNDVMAYGSVSRGFKSGGFPFNIDGDPQADFKPEYADNYEVGIKSRLWDQRLQTNLAIFRTDFTDLQVLQLTPAGQTFAGNAGEAQTQGVELDVNVVVTDAFQVYGNYTYLDAELKSLMLLNEEGDLDDFSGNRPPVTPEHSFNIGGTYTWNLPGDAGKIAMRANVLYKSRYFLETDNNPDVTAKVDNIVNAGIKYMTPGERWEFSLWGKNLTDKRTFAVKNDIGLFIQDAGDFFAGAQTWGVRYDEPRTYGATVRWNY